MRNFCLNVPGTIGQKARKTYTYTSITVLLHYKCSSVALAIVEPKNYYFSNYYYPFQSSTLANDRASAFLSFLAHCDLALLYHSIF